MSDNPPRRGLSILLISVGIVVLCTGIVGAAVSGDFTSEYDGYDDQSDTPARGHEISIEGEIEVSGDSAVEPVIYIKAADSTVLDTNTIKVFVEGDRSLEFDRHYQAGQVVLTTDEIPSDTTIRIQFITYFVGGTDADEIQAGEVDIVYDTPSGASEQKSYTPTVEMTQSPENVIGSLEQGNTLGEYQKIASYVGPALALLFLVIIVLMIRGGGDGDVA